MRSIHSTWNGCMFKDGCRKTEAQRDALRVAIGNVVAWSYDDGPLAGKELKDVIEYAQDQLAKNMVDSAPVSQPTNEGA